MVELTRDGLTVKIDVGVDLGPCDRPEVLPGALRAYLDGMVGVVREYDRLFGERAGARYGSYYELVLDRGRPMAGQSLQHIVRRGPMGYCYSNTLGLISRFPRLRYVEGYAIPWCDGAAGLPAVHCWAVDRQGRVWDATWPEPEHSAYYGMTFSIADVRRFIALDEDTFGILATEHLIGSPLLRTGRLWVEVPR